MFTKFKDKSNILWKMYERHLLFIKLWILDESLLIYSHKNISSPMNVFINQDYIEYYSSYYNIINSKFIDSYLINEKYYNDIVNKNNCIDYENARDISKNTLNSFKHYLINGLYKSFDNSLKEIEKNDINNYNNLKLWYRSLYNMENNGKFFLSIDIKQANYTILKQLLWEEIYWNNYDEHIVHMVDVFFKEYNIENINKEFFKNTILIDSDFRQYILWNISSKYVSKIQRALMNNIYEHIIDTNNDIGDYVKWNIHSINNDEIIIEISDIFLDNNLLKNIIVYIEELLKNKFYDYSFHINCFELEKISEYKNIYEKKESLSWFTKNKFILDENNNIVLDDISIKKLDKKQYLKWMKTILKDILKDVNINEYDFQKITNNKNELSLFIDFINNIQADDLDEYYFNTETKKVSKFLE